MDNAALFKLGYGLYVLTARGNGRDNGCIINTAMQITSEPPFASVITVSKQNLTHDIIMASKAFNISVLTREAPFQLFEHFGFQSGAKVDKLAGYDSTRSENGIAYITEYTNAYLSFQVRDTVDFGSHTMFVADITQGEILGKAESVTYAYYHQHIKPKQRPVTQSGYRCKICGYVYEGEPLPGDFICPICKHGVSDFEKINASVSNTSTSQEVSDMANLKGTKTEANLAEAFAGESQARNKYTYFASKAKKEGYEQIGAFFEETAGNEKEHAKIWFKLLCGGEIPPTAENLKAAASGEHEEWTEMYKRMAAEAREEGFDQIAFLFESVGAIEKEHEERYLKLLQNVEDGSVFAKQEKSVWICRNCGHIVDSLSAPRMCPVCAHPQAYFELRVISY